MHLSPGSHDSYRLNSTFISSVKAGTDVDVKKKKNDRWCAIKARFWSIIPSRNGKEELTQSKSARLGGETLPTMGRFKKIGAYVGATSVTVGLAAAAPFAVMGVIGGMGFTSSGIAAGSTAAGMMSAQAIATGGGVAAGGTVATLQSIGAAGLGLLGTSAAVSGGAAVGGSISAIALASKKSPRGSEKSN